MKKLTKRIFSIVFALIIIATASATSSSDAVAKSSSSVTIGSVVIQGSDVIVTASGSAASEDGQYHLIASDAKSVG